MCVCVLLQPGICITGTLGSTLGSTAVSVVEDIVVELTNTETAVATVATPPIVMLNFQKATNWSQIWGQWELIEHSVRTNTSASKILVQRLNFRFKRSQMEIPLSLKVSAPEYWSEWIKSNFRYHFSHVGGLIHKKCAFKQSSSVCHSWPFENSSSLWEGSPRPSQYLSIQPMQWQYIHKYWGGSAA